MGWIGCPETSLRDSLYSLRNNPERRRCLLIERLLADFKTFFGGGAGVGGGGQKQGVIRKLSFKDKALCVAY